MDLPGRNVLLLHKKLATKLPPLIEIGEPYWERFAQTPLSLVSKIALSKAWSSVQAALKFKVSLRWTTPLATPYNNSTTLVYFG
ncbi:Uncharacterised protein [uncultured archaeon]|nr:Uncharacterised protein [uncultured archaeon]